MISHFFHGRVENPVEIGFFATSMFRFVMAYSLLAQFFSRAAPGGVSYWYPKLIRAGTHLCDAHFGWFPVGDI